MSDLIKKFMPIIIALGVASIGFLFYGIFSNFANNKASDLENMEYKQMIKAYEDMDGRDDIKGSEVLTFLSAHNGDKVCITVTTGKGTKNYNYKDKTLATEETDTTKMITKAKKKTDVGYINPSGTFEASLDYDANKVICQITFKQK